MKELNDMLDRNGLTTFELQLIHDLHLSGRKLICEGESNYSL